MEVDSPLTHLGSRTVVQIGINFQAQRIAAANEYVAYQTLKLLFWAGINPLLRPSTKYVSLNWNLAKSENVYSCNHFLRHRVKADGFRLSGLKHPQRWCLFRFFAIQSNQLASRKCVHPSSYSSEWVIISSPLVVAHSAAAPCDPFVWCYIGAVPNSGTSNSTVTLERDFQDTLLSGPETSVPAETWGPPTGSDLQRIVNIA